MAAFSWLIVLSLLVLWFWKSRRPKGFPSGPWHLPLIGNLLQVRIGNLQKDLDQLGKKYGPVFSVYLGGTPAVITHGFPSAKEVLVIKGKEFAGRPDFPIMDALSKKKGILTVRYGEVWKEQRKFSLMLLRNFGVGKKSMEEKILEEATYLIEAFTEETSVPFDPHEFLQNAVSNIIFTIIFGKRFEYDKSFLKTLLHEIHQSLKMALGPWGLLYNVVPLVRRLPLPHQRILTSSKKVEAFFEKEVEEHKATLVPGEPRDFTDAYLEEMQKAERKSSSFEDEQLRVLLCDLFLAGTETMAGTLLWGFLYLMAFPEIQEKCQKEIDAVLGNNASLKYEDRENLPYTNAVIHEIQRISNVAPLGLPHATIQDVQLFGYKIPKDTMVFVNLHSAHFDESQWKFPKEFNPSNFLNEKGEFVKPEAFLAFSAGPRACLGENLARMELFLFFTSILRNFQLLWPDKSQAPD
ncbi:cytochrome P450 2J6-like, partial [Python bivittatus]|uniref:Cytochrome P450 2J6-like n=1 Tax=Python bivittatus TaxID=176946 RepID=A0A9F3QU94_PYTBI